MKELFERQKFCKFNIQESNVLNYNEKILSNEIESILW